MTSDLQLYSGNFVYNVRRLLIPFKSSILAQSLYLDFCIGPCLLLWPAVPVINYVLEPWNSILIGCVLMAPPEHLLNSCMCCIGFPVSLKWGSWNSGFLLLLLFRIGVSQGPQCAVAGVADWDATNLGGEWWMGPNWSCWYSYCGRYDCWCSGTGNRPWCCCLHGGLNSHLFGYAMWVESSPVPHGCYYLKRSGHYFSGCWIGVSWNSYQSKTGHLTHCTVATAVNATPVVVWACSCSRHEVVSLIMWDPAACCSCCFSVDLVNIVLGVMQG